MSPTFNVQGKISLGQRYPNAAVGSVGEGDKPQPANAILRRSVVANRIQAINRRQRDAGKLDSRIGGDLGSQHLRAALDGGVIGIGLSAVELSDAHRQVDLDAIVAPLAV